MIQSSTRKRTRDKDETDDAASNENENPSEQQEPPPPTVNIDAVTPDVVINLPLKDGCIPYHYLMPLEESQNVEEKVVYVDAKPETIEPHQNYSEFVTRQYKNNKFYRYDIVRQLAYKVRDTAYMHSQHQAFILEHRLNDSWPAMKQWIEKAPRGTRGTDATDTVMHYCGNGYHVYWNAFEAHYNAAEARAFGWSRLESSDMQSKRIHDFNHAMATLGRPLPLHSVLFEGQGSMEPICIEARRARPTSTSWNINVALDYTSNLLQFGQLVVHRIMTPSVMGIYVPTVLSPERKQAIQWDSHSMECEVLLTHGLRMHVVKELVIDKMDRYSTLRIACLVRSKHKLLVAFTHIYDTEVCPCQQQQPQQTSSDQTDV